MGTILTIPSVAGSTIEFVFLGVFLLMGNLDFVLCVVMGLLLRTLSGMKTYYFSCLYKSITSLSSSGILDLGKNEGLHNSPSVKPVGSSFGFSITM
jgi:hypothetical protein